MDDKAETRDEATDAPSGSEDGEEINDPLTRRDVEAPRAEFEGRKPE